MEVLVQAAFFAGIITALILLYSVIVVIKNISKKTINIRKKEERKDIFIKLINTILIFFPILFCISLAFCYSISKIF